MWVSIFTNLSKINHKFVNVQVSINQRKKKKLGFNYVGLTSACDSIYFSNKAPIIDIFNILWTSKARYMYQQINKIKIVLINRKCNFFAADHEVPVSELECAGKISAW